MILITIAFVTLATVPTYGYHDPDLNYHLSQVQKLQGCDDNGYSYPAPAVQLTTAGVKVATPTLFAQPAAQAYFSNTGYSAGVVNQPPPPPQNTYLPQAPASYQATSFGAQSNYATSFGAQSNYATSLGAQSNYATAVSKEVHGYATSAGLSSVASGGRTVAPQATYAQAPIIAKVTAAPLIAKFTVSPGKTVVSQTFAQGAVSARASLNTFGAVHTGGPVVSQVYAAPSATYATSAALKVQSPQVFPQPRYTTFVAPATNQYSQVRPVSAAVPQYTPPVAQYATSSYASNALSAASASQYFSPTVQQYTAPAAAQYVTHYHAQARPVAQVFQYSAPAVTQFAAPGFAQYSQYAGAGVAQYNSANVRVTQHGIAPVTHTQVTHAQAPVTAQVAVSGPVTHAAPAVAAVKNVHTDFLENYDAHPRYAYEYSVNDPHTGDIKQQKEERDGEVVKGQYSLVEPDGSIRTVNYVADWETGFHADVRNSKDNRH